MTWKDILSAELGSEIQIALDKEVRRKLGREGNRAQHLEMYQESAFYLARIFTVKRILEYIKSGDFIKYKNVLCKVPEIKTDTEHLIQAEATNDIVLKMYHYDCGYYRGYVVHFNQLANVVYQDGMFFVPPDDTSLKVYSLDPTPVMEGLLS